MTSLEQRGFTMGIVYAVALLIKTQCEGGAETLWNESGYTIADLKGCDAYDADTVRKYFKKFGKGKP